MLFRPLFQSDAYEASSLWISVSKSIELYPRPVQTALKVIARFINPRRLVFDDFLKEIA